MVSRNRHASSLKIINRNPHAALHIIHSTGVTETYDAFKSQNQMVESWVEVSTESTFPSPNCN